MPQITLEYSANIAQPVDFQSLFADLHAILAEVGGVRIQNCKSRAVRHADFRIGDGDAQQAFVHLTVRVVGGRTAEWKQKIGERILQSLKEHYEKSREILSLQITVHMAEIEREVYFKWPEGTLTPLESPA